MRGYVVYGANESRHQGAILSFAAGKLLNRSHNRTIAFDKHTQELIMVAGIGRSMFGFVHGNCTGEKCGCKVINQEINKEEAGAFSWSQLMLSCKMISPPFFLVMGQGMTIKTAISAEGSPILVDELPQGCYTLNLNGLQEPNHQELCHIQSRLLPWIVDDYVDADDSTAAEMAKELGFSKMLAISHTSEKTFAARVGFRVRSWKPKGYISDYNFFAQRYRSAVLEQTPTLSTVEANAVLGNLWKGLSKVERRLFEDQAELDKLRYWKEVEAYNAQKLDAKIVPKISEPCIIARRHENFITSSTVKRIQNPVGLLSIVSDVEPKGAMNDNHLDEHFIDGIACANPVVFKRHKSRSSIDFVTESCLVDSPVSTGTDATPTVESNIF